MTIAAVTAVVASRPRWSNTSTAASTTDAADAPHQAATRLHLRQIRPGSTTAGNWCQEIYATGANTDAYIIRECRSGNGDADDGENSNSNCAHV